MGPFTQADPRHVLESQIRESFGRAAYTHKTHEKMAERKARSLTHVKWGQILLSALTAGGAIGVLFKGHPDFLPYATAGLSVITLILNSYVKDLDPGAAAQKHREVASDIWKVREGYINLLADIRDSDISLIDLRKRRDDLTDELYSIYRSAPNTDSIAYRESQKALKHNEDLTFTDEEIDAFLPSPLKRTKG